MSAERWIVASVLLTGCFSPEAPAETDGGGEDESSTAGTDPSGGPGTTTASSTDPSTTTPSTTDSTTNPTDTDDPTDATDTDDPSDTDDPTDTGGIECGNGQVEGDEACDDGINDGSYGGCNDDCTLAAYCGDGEMQGSEECDDGDEVDGNGCNVDCVPSGLELWTYEEHVTPEDLCVDIVAADGGHIYMAGQVDNLGGGDDADAFYVQRLSAEGNVEWSREYAPFATSTMHDYDAFAAAESADGVVVVGAHRTTLGLTSYTDVPAVLFSELSGDVVWDRSDDFADFAASIIADDDGSFVIAATTANNFDAYLYRLSAGGDLVGGMDVDAGRRARALALDPDGTYVVATEDQFPTLASLRRVNAGFGPLWEIMPDGLGSPRGVAVAPGGDVFAVGGGWVTRRDSDGAEAWTLFTDDVATLGTPQDVEAADDGGAFIVGTRSNAPWIARINAEGTTMWSRSASEVGEFVAVAETQDGRLVACGTIDGGAQGENIFVATYTP